MTQSPRSTKPPSGVLDSGMNTPVFGRLLTAMVTPFTDAGQLNLTAAKRLAAYLVDEQNNDGIVVNGTTGESPTTSDAEKAELVATVREQVGDSAHVVAGIGSADTAHSIRLANDAAAAGASGLLLVTPYYSRPPQSGVAAHFEAVADATDLPIMIYDIPHRSGVPVESDTMRRLAKHPNLVAVKDAKGKLVASAQLIAETGLQYYAGDDGITLPLLSVGGVGVVGTSTHFTGRAMKELIEAYVAGDIDRARELNAQYLPVFTGVFATQGCLLVKAGLARRGLDVGGVRMPLLPATDQQADTFVRVLESVGL